MPALAGYRRLPLDGAVLWFDRRTGINVRVALPETRALVSEAPRAVMFGSTNHGNMRCSFALDLHVLRVKR